MRADDFEWASPTGPLGPEMRCNAPAVGDCGAARFEPFRGCLRHLSADELAEALATFSPGGDLDARDTEFSEELLTRVLDSFRDSDGDPHFGMALFDNATFIERAPFLGSWFDKHGSFREATFRDEANFEGAVFANDAVFSGASFNSDAIFTGGRFVDGIFNRTQFHGETQFDGARFDEHASFVAAHFLDSYRLGPIAVLEELTLSGAVFSKSVLIEVATPQISCNDVTFSADATISARYARISISRINAAGIVTVSSEGDVFERDGMISREPLLDESVLAELDENPMASMWNLHGADASKLVLVNVDLSQCEFSDVHHLDRVRIEGRCVFAEMPRWDRNRHFPLWHYTRRQMLAEELVWRTTHCQAPKIDRAIAVGPSPQQAERLAFVYRQLRKAGEDAKNEPGAADFYYGEMEMRRHAATTPAAERLILQAYWALSGYGLRATRALAVLMVVLILATVGFATVGFSASRRIEYRPVVGSSAGDPVTYRQGTVVGAHPGWISALEFSLDTSTSLLHTTQDQPLNLIGRLLEILLRFAGPLLVGLAALAVRNRVKR